MSTKPSTMSRTTTEPVASQNGTVGRIQIMNENWRGKTDPLERRRIQNRLNQRAFRERQRGTGGSQQSTSEPGTPDSDDEDNDPRPDTRITASQGKTAASEDELCRTINRNVIQAIISNGQYLGIGPEAFRSSSLVTTPRQVTTDDIPVGMGPIKQQYMVPHDPFIDAIPHARFRFNVLKATANHQIDVQRLGACLRRSGTMATVAGKQVREGLIVWSDPKNIQNWELSEGFVVSFGRLLEGCEDWIAASNWWRQQRGEPSLPVR